MNKKGGIIGFIFGVAVFVILWFVFLGQFLAWSGQYAIERNNLSGWEAFVLANLNLFVFIFLIICIIGYTIFFGGSK